MEHSLRGIGKFDIALLKSDAAKRKTGVISDLVGVVEIIHKSPMKEEKVAELNHNNVRPLLWAGVYLHLSHPSSIIHQYRFHGSRLKLMPAYG
jgi:hypothetical protein